MLTQAQVLDAIRKGEREGNGIDGRDFARLAAFFPESDLEALGFSVKEGEKHDPLEWTEEGVRKQLATDLDFAFEKALDKRGISAGLMCGVVQMWAWILEANDIADSEDYAQYGLPILKAAALKFGLPNPIGDDRGNEYKYSSEG